MTERYRAMTRRRRLLAAIWAGVGATILILLLVSGGRGLPRYLDSFLFGTGAATLASGMVNFFGKTTFCEMKHDFGRQQLSNWTSAIWKLRGAPAR